MSQSQVPQHLELWEAYQADRSLENRNRLVEAYIPLVRRIIVVVLRKMPPSVTADELFGLGSLGLIRAVERFDPCRGVQFHTYLTFNVRSSIVDGMRAWDWLPQSERRLANQGKVRPAEMIPMSVCLASDDGGQDLPLSFATYDRMPIANDLAVLLRNLAQRERLVLRLKYHESLNFREIGERINLSPSATARLHHSILKRLQQSAENPRCCS